MTPLPITLLLASCATEPEASDTAEEGSADTADTNDTAEDTAADSAAPQTPAIADVVYVCEEEACSWLVFASGVLGIVELDMIDTGDPSWECGPTAPPDLVCGVWHEYHNDFRVVELENQYGGETWEISLAVVDDFAQQQNNVSTLFDTEIPSTVTIMATIYDEHGDWAGCFVAGENLSYYEGEGCEFGGGL